MATGFSSAQQQGPGPQAPPAGSVFLTRDTRIFRTVKSPIAVLAGRLYALLSGSSALSAAARRCFAHAVLDHALPNEGAYSAELDAQIREHFASSPPAVVLVQGPFRVDFINEDPPSPGTPKSMSTINTMGSSLTTTSGPSSLLDVVFLGYTLHNELNRCQREDREQYAKLAFFALTSLVHESAHWLFTKMHGYRRDEARFSVSSNTMSQGKGSGMMGGAAPANVNISQAGQKAEDPLISFGQRPDDAGARAVDTLFGCTALLVSWADGDTEVLKRKLKPDVQGERPALSTADIEGLIEARLPPILDITGQPPILIGGPPPKWSTHDAYLVTSQNAANSFCAHGMCRIGQLF